ncbi:ATP-binding protein [Arthrobacter sp. MYb227]|uniref:ATP-binding protein n=1 Tax=Arthrobacter sp. MYb227 TaxID=1848601 RepID=UPI000CFAF47B|nr:ATP-binding protein [Arthrobacter sp. MYb227]PQZ89551.1 ATP-binding protein [Arthrobacter sp. MYb227]
MEPALNPYNPGSGVPPLFMAGRESEIDAFDLLVARTKLSRHSRSMMLSGLRGVGKTVLLNKLRGIARAHGWLTIKIEAQTGASAAKDVRNTLARELQIASRRYVQRSKEPKFKNMLQTVSSFGATFGVTGISLEVDIDPSRAQTGIMDIDLRDVIEDVAHAMRSIRQGFVIFIDEMQDLDEELLIALVTAQHHASQDELPFFVVGAGLPNLPARLADARSYAERLFDYRVIGKLTKEETEESFTIPARTVGPTYSQEALDKLVKASGGYPYFVQEFGSAMWNVATAYPFQKDDAVTAVNAGLMRLDAGFFPSRWDRATPKEREYMLAMAEDGEGPSMTGEIATRLKSSAASIGTYRAQLIAKGLVYSPEHGEIAFTVPGMADFIRRQNIER